MALPSLEQKYFRTKLVSNNKEVQFRPFTIGQQKQVMVIRSTTTNEIDVYKAVISLVQDCVKDITVEDLYIIDFEKLFYDIRTASDGSIIKFSYVCQNDIGEERKAKCEHTNEFELDVNKDVKISSKVFTKQIKIDGTSIMINLRQHKLKDLFIIEGKKYDSDELKALDSLIYCIDSVIEGEKIIRDFTHEEITKFVESLADKYLTELKKFYENAPKIEVEKKFKCEKCGQDVAVGKEGVGSFF